jgi:hypothetical protein
MPWVRALWMVISGEVLGLENDGGREVGKRAAIGHAPLGFHGVGVLAE